MKYCAKVSIDGPDITFMLGLFLVFIFAVVHFFWQLPSSEDIDAHKSAIVGRQILEVIILGAAFIFFICSTYFRAGEIMRRVKNRDLNNTACVWRAAVVGIEISSPILLVIACRAGYGI